MRRTMLLCMAVSVATGLKAGAQTPSSPGPRPTPPPPPFLNAAADFSAWTITRAIIPGLGGQSVEAVIRSIATNSPPESVVTVVKTGRVRHQVRKIKSGEQEDIWYERGNRIVMESMWKIPMFEATTSDSKTPLGPDFPELSWIAATNFVGTQEYQGATYFVFESQVTEGNTRAAKEYGYKLTAAFNRVFVNADTRLPWLHQTGDVLQRYAFQAPPTAVLDVPVEYQTMFDTFEKKKIESSRKPIAP